MVWTNVSSCYSCRHSRSIGQQEFALGEVTLVLVCELDNTLAKGRCNRYEYEPGTDVNERDQ